MAPRRSLRAASSAASTPLKRSRTLTPPTDSSRPAKKAKNTPTKSKYFHTEESIANEESQSEPEEPASPSPELEDSGYEDEDASATEPSDREVEEDEEEDDLAEESDESERPRKKQKRTSGATSKTKTSNNTAIKATKGQELWRTNVKTGAGPGVQVIIDKPKARPAGKTPYQDHTIHPNTMLFLQDLAQNNDREWLKMHDPDFRQSLKDSNDFFEKLQEKIIELDETIPELPILKHVVFRIYRDVRFSKDQTPYKSHFSAAWSRTGRKGPFAAYYVQIKPGGNSFVGGGLWMPEAAAVAALRKDIDKRPQNIKDILLNDGIRKQFLGGVKKDEKLVIKAFADSNKENALKTKPRDYAVDHEYIQLLRLRNYTLGRKMKDDEIVGEGGLERIANVIRDLVPFITYLNSIVMPDEPLEYSSEEDGGSEDEDGEAANADDANGDTNDDDDDNDDD